MSSSDWCAGIGGWVRSVLNLAATIPLDPYDSLTTRNATTSRPRYQNNHLTTETVSLEGIVVVMQYLNFWTWKAKMFTPTLTPTSNQPVLLHSFASPLLLHCIRPKQCSTILDCSICWCRSYLNWMSPGMLVLIGIHS
jgi:hypothetical protein